MVAPEYYTFTGRDGERVPRHITHVLIATALNFVPALAFDEHPNIEEVICHEGVEKIEKYAFHKCPSLRRVIMPGVKVVEKGAFYLCSALTYIDCGKLEIIGEMAFMECTSLSSLDLPSIKILEYSAFISCRRITIAKFGKNLESIRDRTFVNCTSLERIALPLKDGVITHDNTYTFQGCKKLVHVDLVGGVHETVAALLMDEWKDDMNKGIDLISRILPYATAGTSRQAERKSEAIRTWTRSVLSKYNRYKAEHRRYVNDAATTLQRALPNDIVLKSVLPFVELPSDTFGGGD